MLTVCVMMATIMQALDTTIANVALPYMQGTLSATQDQINWVLTSYIVAAAIMTSPLGWTATRFGRKKLFIVCAGGFTVASMLCGVAQDLDQMVAFRLLQGVFGAALVPLRQAVMLDIYPPAQRGAAMAIWGMGVMLGPIMGPTLGGWLTDAYSWRWVFFVNLPFGVLTVIGLSAFMTESAAQARHSLRVVRLSVAVARHRRPADDARSRRGPGLVRFSRDHHRGDPVGRSASISFSPIPSPRQAVHPAAHLPRLEFFDRRHLHVPDRRHPSGHDGAGDAVPAESEGLSRPGERLFARRARRRDFLSR